MSDARTRPIDDNLNGRTGEVVTDEVDAGPAIDTAPEAPEADAAPAAKGGASSLLADRRFLVVVLGAVLVLVIAFVFVIALAPTPEGVSALAVIAAPIALIVTAYFAISLALRLLGDARAAAEAAEERAAAAEQSARESDAWAAQMESGLRVAMTKLRGSSQTTTDVERAAGTPADFF